MKRFTLTAAALLLLCLVLSGCTKQEATGPVPYEELPADYTIEQAIGDGCVVFTDQKITAGQDIWDAFVGKAQNGEAAQVRLAYYYSFTGTEAILTEEEMTLPLLYVKDLTYDEGGYTLRYDESGVTYRSTYPYLVKYEGEVPEDSMAIYSAYLYYALVHDDTLTYDDLFQSLISAQASDYIDFTWVYTDLID